MGTRLELLTETAAMPSHSAAQPTAEPRPSRPEPVRHLNQEQLARRWGISPRTLERHRWLCVGVPYLKLHGRVAYRLEDILAYEDQHRRGTR